LPIQVSGSFFQQLPFSNMKPPNDRSAEAGFVGQVSNALLVCK